jgi:glutathione S-transferase
MLTLYHDHNAVCCQKVELALFEKGVTYKDHIISLFRSEQYSTDYLKINPRGVVPALLHDGSILIESTVICEYVNETFDGPSLLPNNSVERAHARVWTKLVDDEIHQAGSTLSFCAMFRDRMLKMDKEEQEKRYRNVGNPIREDMYRSTVELGVGSPIAFCAIASYEMMIRDLELRLADTNGWIAGGMYSLAEIGQTPYFARVEFLGLLDIWLANRPLVRKWWEKVKARRSYSAIILGPLTDNEIIEMKNSGEKIYDHVAERRKQYINTLVK